jgi:hypothetical protein
MLTSHDITESRTTEQIRPHDVDKPWYNLIKEYTEPIRPQDVDKACSVIAWLVNIMWSYWLCVVLDSVISWLVNILWSYLLCVVLDSVISCLVNILWSYWLWSHDITESRTTQSIRPQDVDKAWYNWIKDYTEQIRPQNVDKPWYNWIKDYTEQIRPFCGLVCSV